MTNYNQYLRYNPSTLPKYTIKVSPKSTTRDEYRSVQRNYETDHKLPPQGPHDQIDALDRLITYIESSQPLD